MCIQLNHANTYRCDMDNNLAIDLDLKMLKCISIEWYYSILGQTEIDSLEMYEVDVNLSYSNDEFRRKLILNYQ